MSTFPPDRSCGDETGSWPGAVTTISGGVRRRRVGEVAELPSLRRDREIRHRDVAAAVVQGLDDVTARDRHEHGVEEDVGLLVPLVDLLREQSERVVCETALRPLVDEVQRLRERDENPDDPVFEQPVEVAGVLGTTGDHVRQRPVRAVRGRSGGLVSLGGRRGDRDEEQKRRGEKESTHGTPDYDGMQLENLPGRSVPRRRRRGTAGADLRTRRRPPAPSSSSRSGSPSP